MPVPVLVAVGPVVMTVEPVVTTVGRVVAIAVAVVTMVGPVVATVPLEVALFELVDVPVVSRMLLLLPPSRAGVPASPLAETLPPHASATMPSPRLTTAPRTQTALEDLIMSSLSLNGRTCARRHRVQDRGHT
jgi:hypothetical protein